MDVGQWLLVALNAGAASVLLNAGVAKIVAPGHLERALAEIVPFRLIGGWPRVVAVLEMLVAGALPVSAIRVVGAFATSGLGLGFAAVGLLGVARGSSVPCGCLGGSSRKPLGWANVGAGVALGAAGPVNLAGHAGAEYAAGSVLLAALGAVVVCLWAHRRLVVELLVVPRRAEGGVR